MSRTLSLNPNSIHYALIGASVLTLLVGILSLILIIVSPAPPAPPSGGGQEQVVNQAIDMLRSQTQVR